MTDDSDNVERKDNTGWIPNQVYVRINWHVGEEMNTGRSYLPVC